MHLSFAGCGFLGIYHLGAARALTKCGVMSQVDKMAGASAGSLIAALFTCVPDAAEDCTKFIYNLAKEVRAKPLSVFTPGYDVLDSVHDYMSQILPQDCHLRASHRTYISLTHVQKRKYSHHLVSEFKSKDELIACLLASCFIPGQSGFKIPVINGKKYLDGGMTNNLYIFPDGRTIAVNPFSGGKDICPVDNKGFGWFMTFQETQYHINLHNMHRLVRAILPNSHEEMKAYYKRGYDDAIQFLRKHPDICCV
ncbi:hypothetical protein ACJMK2_017797 [Sinanodonta woodiana]|uniref:PNPLA domain-containing protein n=1 Tax=Sinanodonta woodiana TaxID=1069815 RepID=A0ABD3UFA4_SINWO